MRKIFNKYGFEIILGLLITIYIVFFSYLSIKRYRTLNSHYYDLGIMNQVVYNTSQGRFLEMTDQDSRKNINRIAIHFDPILAMFAPLYKIYSGPETLLISQTIILGLGALAVFLIANKVLKKKGISLIFVLSYLFYFPVQRANIFDFHAVTLATTFLLFAFYFLLVKKNFWLIFFILLSLLCKEHVGLLIIIFGIYIFFVRKERKLGILIFSLGLIFFISTVYFLIPYFRQGEHFALRYFQGSKIKILFSQETIKYGLRLIIPMFYGLFSPFTLMMALPELAINIFSLSGNMRAIYFHYNALIVSVFIFSSILGYHFIDVKIKNKIIKSLILIIFIFLNIFWIYSYDPLPWKIVKQPVTYNIVDLSTILKWQDALKDDKIKVATTPVLAPFFTERQYYYNFLFDSAYTVQGFTDEDIMTSKINNYKLADYVIINLDEIGNKNAGTLPVKFYQNFRQDKNYKMIFSNNKNIEVYKKI